MLVFSKHMEIETGLSLVYDALRRVNQIRPPEAQVPQEPDVVLLGDKGLLDSMAVTILIVTLENLLREKTGREVSLLQEADFEVEGRSQGWCGHAGSTEMGNLRLPSILIKISRQNQRSSAVIP
jgi:hypothetical protein